MAWTTSVKLGGTVPPSFLTVWSAFNDRKVSKNSTHRLPPLCVQSGRQKTLMNQQRFAPTTTTNLYKIYIYKEKFSFVFSRGNSSPQFLAAEEKKKKKSLVSEDSWKIDRNSFHYL